ncbi:MAG: sigma-70 family RNA polymerase sigma factor [Clostridium beijerinckii]|nr:sigma-70 family RNA polymerase sigma factor [Clostridium beijerinckii]
MKNEKEMTSKNDENLYKKVEGMLYHYTSNKIRIENRKIDLEELENDYRGIGCIGYEEHTSPTNKFNSNVENEIVKRDEKIIRLRNEIKIMKNQILRIDNAMGELKDYERSLIELKYFKKVNHEKIADELGFEVESIAVMKSRIINKLVPLIY